MSISELETLCAAYAKARSELAERVSALEAELSAAKRRHIRGIKTAAARATDLQAQLHSAIAGAPEFFEEPRTQTFSGIKVGYQKGKGKLDWDDDAKVCAKIRKLCSPTQAEALIRIEEHPNAEVLKSWSASELAKFGIRIEGTGDQIVIKASDSEIDKLVASILKEGLKLAEEVAA